MGDFSTSRRPRSAKVCVKLRSASCQQNRTSTGDPRNPRHNSVNSFEVPQPHLREKKKETTGFDVLRQLAAFTNIPPIPSCRSNREPCKLFQQPSWLAPLTARAAQWYSATSAASVKSERPSLM